MEKGKLVGLVVVLLFLGAIGYFFISTESTGKEIPPYVSGEMRTIYEWAKTPEGWALLEQIPCYCGCKYEGHRHNRDCFWRDDGTFDKHGITCSVCLDIAKKAKQMNEQGADVCEIIKEVDEFYKPNAHLRTETPIPKDCG